VGLPIKLAALTGFLLKLALSSVGSAQAITKLHLNVEYVFGLGVWILVVKLEKK
jgi:hypothetical protein